MLDIVDGAFAAVRQRPRTLVGCALPVIVPLALVQSWLTRRSARSVWGSVWADGEAGADVAAADQLVAWITGALFRSLAVSLAAVGVAAVMFGWFEGRDPGVRDGLAAMVRRSPVALSAWLLSRLAVLVATVLVVPALPFVALFSLVSPVVAVERRGPLASLRRSWTLVVPRLWPVLGAVVLTATVSVVVAQSLSVIPGIAVGALGPERAWPVVAATEVLSSLLLVPFVAASATLLYVDQRYRVDGLDLEIEAAEVLPGVG